jgi:hypothetical protein
MQPITNPYIEQHLDLLKENSSLIKYAHKFFVEGIYNQDKPIEENTWAEMRTFCTQHHIHFTVREFNSDLIEEDREMVLRLPAYQIYNGPDYERTLYLNEDYMTQFKTIIASQEKVRKKDVSWFSWIPRVTIPTMRTFKKGY